MMMISIFSRFIHERKAAVLPMAALLFPVILGMTGLGVDASNWMMTRRNLQNAADAAAISAAWEIANGYDHNYEDAALSEAQNNGYDPDKPGSTLNVEYTVDEEDGTESVTANLSMRGELWFSALLFNKEVSLANAAATAIIQPTGNFCILSLDEEADGAISAMGNATIDANGCGLAVNSNSDTALDFTGSVVVHVDDVSIVGDHDVSGGVDFEYDSMRTGANPIPDPYTDLEVPSHSCSSYSNTQVKTDQTITNSGIRTFCGGLSISSGAVVEFEPGIYIIDGGDFSINSGTVTGEGVTFILTNSGGGSWGNFDITGGDISFSAPGEGEDMAGIVFYQDRNAPASIQRNKFVGNGNINLDGVVYTPSRALDFGGNSGATSETCTKLIGKTIKLHGNPAIGNNCDGNSDIMNIGIPNIKLIQ